VTIKAIYQRGILKLAKKLKLKERQPVLVDIRPLHEDVPVRAVASLAQKSKRFRFLQSPAEDLYSLKDGKPVAH
jgi:predicted DNA-binding antitoxin AbrB/MazE fold protein